LRWLGFCRGGRGLRSTKSRGRNKKKKKKARAEQARSKTTRDQLGHRAGVAEIGQTCFKISQKQHLKEKIWGEKLRGGGEIHKKSGKGGEKREGVG